MDISLGNLWLNLGKPWRSWGGEWQSGEDQQSQLTGALRSLRHWATNQAANTSCCEAPDTYTAEDCLVWPHWEKTHLTLRRSERPQWVGKSEGEGVVEWGHTLGDRGGGRRYSMGMVMGQVGSGMKSGLWKMINEKNKILQWNKKALLWKWLSCSPFLQLDIICLSSSVLAFLVVILDRQIGYTWN